MIIFQSLPTIMMIVAPILITAIGGMICERSGVVNIALEGLIKEIGKEQVIEKVAYTWFNRFCALRFMDVNRYSKIGVVSPAEGQTQPEILAEA